jgi:hypothetical protein
VKRCGSTDFFERQFDCLEPRQLRKLEFLYADCQSNDACETISLAIRKCNISGPIYVKDADGSFEADEIFGGNYVHFTSIIKEDDRETASLTSHFRPDLVDAMFKSYVTFQWDNLVSNISYGSLNSSNFCCGGFSFLEAEQFVEAVDSLRTLLSSSSLEDDTDDMKLKVVDVVFHLCCQGHLFFGMKAKDYNDWGSNAAWLASLNVSYRGRQQLTLT